MKPLPDNIVQLLVRLLFILSFGVSYGQELSRDSLVNQYFTRQEVTQLNDLIDSFEKQINRVTGQRGVDSYWSYLKRDSLYVANALDYESYRIPPEEAQRILYALDSSLFNKIFDYGYGINPDTRQPESRSVSPKFDGPYVQMGIEIGRTDWFWQQYADAVASAGDISPALVVGPPFVARQHLDLDRFSDRLLIALHYLLTMAPEEEVAPSEVDLPWLNPTEEEPKPPDRRSETLLVIKNYRPDTVVAELWMYPAEGYPKNKAGAFDKRIAPDDSLLLVYDSVSIYEGNVEISATYQIDEQQGYEVLIYENLADELIIFGDTKKDTLYARRHSVDELINVHPLTIDIK